MHRVTTALHAPRHTTREQWRWRAVCQECGPVGGPHDDVTVDESYERAKVDRTIHETYPDGTVIMVGGAEVHLR